VLLTQWGGGEVGGEAFVVPDASPNPLGSRLSASVSRSPHSRPTEVVPNDHTERGPLSTILSPHNSQTKMTLLEGSSTTRPPPCRAARTNVAYPESHHNVNLTDALALSIMVPSVHAPHDRRQGKASWTWTSAQATHRAEARVHLYLDRRLRRAASGPGKHTYA
jgi:hypothetical protein